MVTSRWQKQHIHFQRIVWGVSAVIALLLIILLLLLEFAIEVAGVFFIVVFVLMRVLLAFIFNNRFANSMVRILKFEHEEIERDFRIVFKNKNIRFHRKTEEDAYRYEFLGRSLCMTVQPYWLSHESKQPVTKVTLYEVTAKNKAFAEMLAEAIDEMDEERSGRVTN